MRVIAPNDSTSDPTVSQDIENALPRLAPSAPRALNVGVGITWLLEAVNNGLDGCGSRQ